MTLTRRDALKLTALTALGTAAVAVPMGAATQAKSVSLLSDKRFPRRYVQPLLTQPVLTPTMVDGTAHYELVARQGAAQIVPGLTTQVWGYNGIAPGPTIRVERGTPAVVRVRNHLPRTGPWGTPFRTSVHLHGSESAPQYDGYAADITPPGFYKDYHFPNTQPARTLWYHDHGQHWTAQNVYAGLAAQYILHDPVERALLPQGRFDVPLTVSDAMFNADGSLAFDDRTHSGLWGDVILVNGRAWPRMTVQRRTYRFRILVASVARSFRWQLSNGMPLQVVATDGGLVPQGVAVKSFRHAGAERYEVVIDFSKVPAGTTRVELLNLSNANNRDYDFTRKVLAFDLSDEPVDTTDPTWNQNYDRYPLAPSDTMSRQPTGDEHNVRLRVQRTNELWTINGKSWLDVVDSGYRDTIADPALGETQIWEIENRSGGWFHPLHIHLIDFKILSRNGRAPLPHEAGPKDVVYVGENETVRLLCNFGSPSQRLGRYMVHCHNLPHEDHDMMQQFSVGGVPDEDPNDPVLAAPPLLDPTYAP